ncbi:MAG: cytochrome C [Desulfuromonas sp.]|uniref:c(7)-type cytochrome triheme domain-containing protein n=1 Tax=Desulfuromonas sp. TaxID=892 RepID=UPI000CBE72F8|nr:c(7)-type cytochrome triheme domain-containing protein [Desulfuromonas sp.]PLX82999.1 MAG: cytochrome C [Desulfuromonas sp.]
MLRRIFPLVTLCGVLIAAVAFAAPPGKVLEFNKSPMGTVLFDGQKHKDAGAICKDCHNKDMFPKMKQGTINITMEELYAGRLCGVCHNGERAFGTKGNCTKCHVTK